MGELKKSDICTAYNLGPNCVACCIIDADVCAGNALFELEFDMHYGNGIYEKRKAKFLGKLQETSQRFEEIEERQRILAAFKRADRYNPQECVDPEGYEMFRCNFRQNTGFIGLISDQPGCLLREKHTEYLHTECISYLCPLVFAAEANPKIHSVLKEFISQEKPDSFMYSRIIHILAHHEKVHSKLKISRHNPTLEQLLFLKEFVQEEKGEL